MTVGDLYHVIFTMNNTGAVIGNHSTDRVINAPQNEAWSGVDTKKRLLGGKLVDTVPSGSGATPVDAKTAFYRSPDGTLSTNPSSGVLTSLAVEAKIQAGIDSLKQELAEAKQKWASWQFWSKIYASLLNRANPIHLTPNSNDDSIIALAVVANNLPSIWSSPTSQTPNTPTQSTSNVTTNVNPSSTPVNNNTTTAWSPTQNTKTASSQTPQANNQKTIDALMAQLNGTRISDVTATPTTSWWTSISRVRRRSKAWFAVEVPIISLSKILTNQSLKSIVRLSQSLNANKNNPVEAIAAIYGHRSIRKNGVLSWWYIKAMLKSKAFRTWLLRKPEKVSKAMNDAITFYTDALKNITKENGFDDKTTQFKTQFLNQLVSVRNTYMAQWANRYVSQMSGTTIPTATTPQAS